MGAPVKFLFDDDFESGQPPPARRAVPLAAHEAALARAEADGFRKGVNAAEAKIEGRATSALERIGQAIAAMAQGLAAVEARLEAESVEVAVAVARKLAPELIATAPLAEITALASSCFHQLVAAPHVVVRVAPPLYEIAQPRLDQIAHLHGFQGRLVVLADPAVAIGDCRIEWADGGVSRDREATQSAIGEAVDRYVTARRETQ
jgi:flagellar assembly protein FliH